jgi:hypothetical protein
MTPRGGGGSTSERSSMLTMHAPVTGSAPPARGICTDKLQPERQRRKVSCLAGSRRCCSFVLRSATSQPSHAKALSVRQLLLVHAYATLRSPHMVQLACRG